MPMFNLFSEVNILNASTIKKIELVHISYIIIHYRFFALISLFAKIPEITNNLIFEKKKYFSVSIRIALRKLEKYRF